MRIGLLGGAGQLGTELRVLGREAGHEVLAPASAALDICDARAVGQWVLESRCPVYVNCAAFTRVDAAEAQPARAYAVNAAGAGNVARAAAALGARVIHVSTDFVFDGSGQRPWVESDRPAPLNAYGRTKLAGERAVLEANLAALVVRIGWVFGRHGSNFVKTILGRARQGAALRVVDDQVGGPCSAALAAAALLKLCEGDIRGVLHLPSLPYLSWYRFARVIVDEALAAGLLAAPVEVQPVSSAEFAAAAPRPANSRLASDRLQPELGLAPLDWRPPLTALLDGWRGSGELDEGPRRNANFINGKISE